VPISGPQGEHFGHFNRAPYVKLDGDDRGDTGTGDKSQEVVRVNSAHLSELRRVLFFATIYRGAARWARAQAVVTITVPGQQASIIIELDSRSSKRTCALVLMECTEDNKLKFTRYVTFHRSRIWLDRAYHWGLKWRSGTKY
jgi:tellurite resistance protein TerA